MPWAPELFSAPVVERLLEKRRLDELVSVPYFEGFLAGEPSALVESFTAEPELHDPVRGRVKGVRAFEDFAAETTAWLRHNDVSVEEVEHAVMDGHGLGEVVLHLDGDGGPLQLPVAIVADRSAEGRIDELRVYSSSWPLTGRHANRPPLLQPDPELRPPGVVDDHLGALAAGDVDAMVATFESDGYAREPAGVRYIHRGIDGVRAFYERLFSNGGGIALERCALVDDGRRCVLEYNVVGWGETRLQPQAGVSVYVRGDSGKLAAVRIYDDVDPPIAASW